MRSFLYASAHNFNIYQDTEKKFKLLIIINFKQQSIITDVTSNIPNRPLSTP